ncbi:MAG: trigger factor, partial [Dialister sp.]|nr:trigger factor [Dialister sp.]
MNVKTEALDQHKVQLTIEVPAEVVVKGFKQAVSRIANQVRIPGFRKGKASRRILEMHFGKDAVSGEAQDIVINQALNDALAQEKLIPVTTPEIKQDRFSEEEGAAFTATFVKQPEVKLGEYKGLSARHVNPEITDEQVMAQITQAAQQNARLEKAEDGAVLKKGDIAVIDFKGYVDGKAFEGGEGKTYPLEIGSHSFIPGFEDQLEGHKAGDDVTVKVSFPENYGVEALAGKASEFSVHINDVKRKTVPVIDDAFAKSVSRYET